MPGANVAAARIGACTGARGADTAPAPTASEADGVGSANSSEKADVARMADSTVTAASREKDLGRCGNNLRTSSLDCCYYKVMQNRLR
jgi:hypothetical protein